MKKSLLFSAALMAAGAAVAATPTLNKADFSAFSAPQQAKQAVKKAATRADMESFDFTYSEAPATGYNLNGTTPGTTRVYVGFEMRPEDIKMFAGSKVTGFTVVSPFDQNFTKNTITEARFFCSEDLETVTYSQDFKLSASAGDINTLTVDEPYTIKGDEESLFFGYSFIVPKANNMYYIIVDYVPNFDSTAIYGMTNDEGMPEQFYAGGSEMGALCMAITLEREHLPQFANFYDFPEDIIIPVGKESTFPVNLLATSGSQIKSVDIEYTLAGNTYSDTYSFTPAVGAGASKQVSVDVKFPALPERLSEKVDFKITKINGVANEVAGEATTNVLAVPNLPKHQTLYEEYTGVWCGYCPRGFAALEYIAKNYPEFVTVSFHYSQGASQPDPMQTLNFYPNNVSGFPAAVLNRTAQVDPYYGTERYNMAVPVVGDILAANALPTLWNINVAHEWASENELVVKADVSNVVGYENGDYKIAYILVADGLSGSTVSWRQSNYYASKKAEYVEELNQFCKGGVYGKSTVIGLVYNDVVVSPDGVKGVDGSIPAALEADETVSHSFTYDLSKISSTLIPDKQKLRVVAAVLDKNGSVLNCAKDEVNDSYGTTGVEGMIDENAPVEYYNLNGVKVSNPTEGIFIRRQGAKAEKVIVK